MMKRLPHTFRVLMFCALPLCAGLGAPSAAGAEELAPGFNACAEKAQSTAEQVECYTAAYNYWDKVLNANFKKAQAGCEAAADAKECRAKLLKAQRLWIQYKEAMADSLYASGGGGTMDHLTVGHFAARETKKQAQLLGNGE